MSESRSPASGFALAIVGGVLFLQVTVGGGVSRLLSYADESKEPKDAGPRGSVATKTRRAVGTGRLRVRPGVKRGDQEVIATIRPAVAATGKNFTCISWHRPGAVTRSGRTSCHTNGRRTGKGAMDLIPDSGDWSDCDALDTELRQTPGVGEVIFRGDRDHDPAAGAKDPHLHAAVNCG